LRIAEYKQTDPNNPGLKESDAWPAEPQDAYGLEKLVSEELCKHYGKDFGIEFRIGRFHNIYGTHVRLFTGHRYPIILKLIFSC
jgi:GDP-D-mannose 3',5'-epimerase